MCGTAIFDAYCYAWVMLCVRKWQLVEADVSNFDSRSASTKAFKETARQAILHILSTTTRSLDNSMRAHNA